MVGCPEKLLGSRRRFAELRDRRDYRSDLFESPWCRCHKGAGWTGRRANRAEHALRLENDVVHLVRLGKRDGLAQGILGRIRSAEASHALAEEKQVVRTNPASHGSVG